MRKYFIILSIFGLLLYLPSLFGPFLWDDEDFVYANKYVANFQLDKFFTASITEGRGKGSNYFRPLQETMYATTHAIFGFNSFWYHLLNVSVHILATVSIFYFFHLLLSTSRKWGDTSSNSLNANESGPNLKGSVKADERFKVARWQDPKILDPFFISLLFLIHPVQTEAVSYISGLSDPLYVFFGFLSLIFILRSRLLPSLIFFILSVLSKETGLVFLPILILTGVLTEQTQKLKKIPSFLLSNLKKYLPYLVASVLYLWYHFTSINNFDIKSAWGNNPYSNSILIRISTFIANLYTYVGLLLFPKDLFMERDYSITVQTKILSPFLIGFIFINLLIIFILWKFKKSSGHDSWKFKILSFCYLSFYISFVPYSGVVLINGIFYEHFLYLPLVFFFAFAFIPFEQKIIQIFQIPLGRIFIIGLILILCTRTIFRELDWTNAVRFYSQTLGHAPQSIRIINGLGMSLAENGDFDSAVRTYQSGIKINPRVPNLYHNLANTYAAKGDLKSAEKYYLMAIEVDPKFFFSYQSLANLYEQTGQSEKLQKLIELYQKNK